MGLSWGPGRYDKSALQQASGSGPGGGPGCACDKTCCIAGSEKHYQVTTNSGTTAIDAPGSSPTLSNRVAIEFYNAGTVTFEVSNKPFTYGDGNGRPVLAGASYPLQVGAANSTAGTQHYIQGASSPFDCRVTELGV